MSDSDDPNPWIKTIRRAFDIPDGIAVRHVNEIIARQVLEKHLPPPPSVPGAKPDIPPFPIWAMSAELVVKAFVTAANKGHLDLPLCGFGTVTNNHLAEHRKGPDETAVAAVDSLIKDDDVPKEERKIWIAWLWEQFVKEVKADPYPGSPEPS
ncbi:MAG: hypothetical protein ACLQRM_16345 [Acidimicrobiales bacterium]